MPICGKCGAPFHGTHCTKPPIHTEVAKVVAKDNAPPVLRSAVEEKRTQLKTLSKAWGHAIIETDRHSTKCRKCDKRKIKLEVAIQTGALATIDPYKPCAVALELWKAEVDARKAYQAAGGRLG
jgi:hypothetical protein